MQSLFIRRLAVLLLALACAWPLTGNASGTYTPRPPRPAMKGEKIDSAKYDLGKRIFTGKAKLGSATTPGDSARLAALQSRLPAKEQKKANLTALAGKLTAQELDALEYYVAQRFPQK